MDRQDVLKAAVSVAAATGALGATRSYALPAQGRTPVPQSQSGPYIRTRDGQRLFGKDWGKGMPIVFLGAWALPSDMWDYQMVQIVREWRAARGMSQLDLALRWDFRLGTSASSRPGERIHSNLTIRQRTFRAAVREWNAAHRVSLVSQAPSGPDSRRTALEVN